MHPFFRLKIFFAFLLSILRMFSAPPTRSLYRDPCAGNENTINHYVNKFDDDLKLTYQQTQSRLEGRVTTDYSITGASKSFDTLGQSEMQLVTGQNQDHQSAGTQASRRWIDLADYDWHDFVDTFEKLKVLEDPTNKYVTLCTSAGNRTKDRLIINALGADARQTVGAGNAVVSSYVALPAAQKIVHGGANITMAKIRTALELLNGAEAGAIEEGGERTFVYTASQLTILMADVTLASADYNTLRALQNFQVDHFMGMKWIRTEQLPKTGTTRSCYIFTKDAIGLGVGEDFKTDISQRKDKRGLPWQVYAWLSGGAVRGQDKGVVEIQCTET